MLDNPLLRRELLGRLRVRSDKGATVATAAIGALIICVVYWAFFEWMQNASTPGDYGRAQWETLFVLEYLFICLVAPSAAANAITQEKEQQTWEMLVFTLLKPHEIILGKLAARLTPLLLVILAFLPLSIIEALFGASTTNNGVTLTEFMLGYLLLFSTSFFFVTVSLFLSWVMKRTIYAIITSYTFVIGLLCIGTSLITGAIATFLMVPRFYELCPLMWINPMMLMTKIPGLDMTNTDPSPVMVLFTGIAFYIVVSVLLIWRMVSRFRNFVYE